MAVKFHFLNVGHGDTTIVEFPDNRLMVVDFNRSNEFDEETARELAQVYELDFKTLQKSGGGFYTPISKYYDIALDDPLSYLKENFSQRDLYRYVQTHPDIDHLAGFKALTDDFTIANFWDTDHKSVTKENFLNDSDKEDWEHYLNYRKDKKLIFYRSSGPITGKNESYPYKLYVFHPTREAVAAGDSKENPKPNYFSYLILIDYCGFKTILGGDVTEEYWKYLWNWLGEHEAAKHLFQGIHVLKASHHGRKSGRCGWEEKGSYKRDFLNWMNPDHVIISVGKKPEGCDATEWYRRRPDNTSRNILTTRWYGTIWASYNGTTPFSRDKVVVETRYDRNSKRDYVQPLAISSLPKDYTLKIGAKLSPRETGPFRLYQQW